MRPLRNIPRGMTLSEVTLALVIAVAATGGLAQLASVSAAHRRTSEVRRLALQEVANQAERIALWKWDELTAERLTELKPSGELLSAAPQAMLTAKLSAEDGPPAAKRVRLEVTWISSAGQAVEPVGLTIWKYQAQEGPP